MVLYQAGGLDRTLLTKSRASPSAQPLNNGRAKSEVGVSTGICGPEKSHTTQRAACRSQGRETWEGALERVKSEESH